MRKYISFALLLLAISTLTACGKFFVSDSTSNGTNGGGNNGGGNNNGGGTTTTPKFAYVANFNNGSGNVSAFTVNATSGALTAVSGSPFATTHGSNGIAADAGGKFVYVSNQTGGVSGFTVNRTSGALTQVSGSPFPSGDTPASITVDPSARFVYVANVVSGNTSGYISGYTVNSTSGVLTPFSGTIATTSAPAAVRIDPTGRFVYAAVANSGVQIFKINTDGTLAAVKTVAPAPCGAVIDIVFDANFHFAYTVDGSLAMCAWAINASTGNLTAIGTSNFVSGNTPFALAINPAATALFVVNKDDNNVSAFTLAADGTPTATSPATFNVGNSPVSAAVDPSGKFLYVANQGDGTVSVMTIGSSGTLTAAGSAVATAPGAAGVIVTK